VPENPACEHFEAPFKSSLFNLPRLKEEGLKVGDVLATDPQLLEKFMQHLSRTVRRDEVTKNMVLLTGISAYTKNPINLFMRGPSGIGKTYNTMQTLRYFPKEDVLCLGGLSPTALVHDHGVLVDINGEEIDFNLKPDKSATKEEKRAWKEKLQQARYVVDLRKKILVFLEPPHIETYNKLRPILSHDKEEISYKFTDKELKGRLRTTHVVIKGWPATIFCSTEERYVEDLATRGFTITPEMGSEKYRAGIGVIGERKALPWMFHDAKDFDFMLLQGYFGWLKNKLETLNVAIPYARELGKCYPSVYARSMRDFDHFTALLEISAQFHYAQRPVLVIEGKEENLCILATMRDLEYVVNLWKSAEETTVTGLPGHILDFYHKVVEPLAEHMALFSYEDLTKKYNEVFEQKKSSWTIRKWVKLLCDAGYLDTEPNPEDRRMVLVKVIKQVENVCDSWIPRFLSSFKLENFKNWLDDAKKILETNEIFLKDNLSAEPSPLESIYTKHFVSNIFSASSKPELGLKTENKPENIGFQRSQRILGEKPCEVCGRSGRLHLIPGHGIVYLCPEHEHDWEGKL
jgi:hypothetical protein